jgi:hypothetical protein
VKIQQLLRRLLADSVETNGDSVNGINIKAMFREDCFQRSSVAASKFLSCNSLLGEGAKKPAVIE